MDLDVSGLTPLDAAPAAQPQSLDVSGLTPLERALPWETAAPGQEQAKWSEVPGALAEFGKQTIQGIGSALSLPGDVFEAGYKGNANPLEDPEMQARAVNLAGLVTLGGRAAPREAPVGNAEQFLREADAVDARLRGAKTKAEIDEFIRSKEAQRAAAPDTSQKLLPPPETPAEVPVATAPAPVAPPKPVSGVPLADSLRERLGLTGEPPADEAAPEPPQAAVEPVTPPSTQMVPVPTEPIDSLPVAPEDALSASRSAPKSKAPLSIAQFIARNGGLELSDETKARDYDKVFVPGGGPLARKSGLSIDGYWRTKLMEAGYLPYDPDGYSSRDIRPELDDALHQDVAALKGSGSDRFYSENDRGRVPAKPEAISDVEAAAKQILDAHAKEGVTRDQIDTKSLYDAAELLVNGEEKDPINALERAYLQEHHNEAERSDTRQTGTQIAGEGEQGIGPRPQESPLGGGGNWAGFSESGKEPTDIGAEGFSQPKQASLDEFKVHIARLKADRDAFKSEIQQAMDTNGRYKMDVNYGNGQNSLLLTKNIGELPYRVTRFDGKEPTGHFEVRNLDEAAQEMIGSRKKPPQTEAGVEGKPQLIIPGAEKVGQGELAQRAANAPLKPTVAQKPADEGLFGDAHKQKDLFGEGENKSYGIHTDLGAFEHDKNAPLGQQAQNYTLSRGRSTGLEHIVAFDANGNVVVHGHGTANNTGMTPTFEAALMNPENSIVVHHNHPGNASLSTTDVATLTVPGLKAVWAHGHGGAVYRGELTDRAAAAFGKFAGGSDLENGYKRIYNIRTAASDAVYSVLNTAIKDRSITAQEANAVHHHLTNVILRDAGILDYQTNFDAKPILDKLSPQTRLKLQNKIIQAAKDANGETFDGREKLISDSLANDRRAWGVRHTGDLGATFGPSGESSAVNPQAGNAQARPQDDSQKVGQLGLPGIGGVRDRPVSEQLKLLEETPSRAAGGRVEAANINHNPTEAQKASGNYAKDRISWNGLKISIENAKGSQRSGIGKDGKEWRAVLPHHYGYVLGTEAKDGDHVDVCVGAHPKSPRVYVIDQINHETGAHDEAKCMICFANEKQAVRSYKAAFSDGKGGDRIGKVTEASILEFKEWLADGNTKKPFVLPRKSRSERVADIVSRYGVQAA